LLERKGLLMGRRKCRWFSKKHELFLPGHWKALFARIPSRGPHPAFCVGV
jgi:hypothetical protein